MERLERHACCGGWQEVWSHRSATLGCTMRFGIYLPPQTERQPCPVLYWLSGLACTEQNFITKAGAQRYAAVHGLVLVAPDTSPRGAEVADDPAIDLGQGAGFYLNAVVPPWSAHYFMYDYVVDELPRLIETNFPVTDARAVSGHSMGGHGALVVALKNPDRYRSASAFAPIAAPARAPWGEKAFTAYLGPDRAAWHEWDASELLGRLERPLRQLLVDQGADDPFLTEQLRPELLRTACERAGQSLELRVHAGYDHSYYFVATFVGDHLAHHARALT